MSNNATHWWWQSGQLTASLVSDWGSASLMRATIASATVAGSRPTSGLVRIAVIDARLHDGLNASAQQVLTRRLGIAELACRRQIAAVGQTEPDAIAVLDQREISARLVWQSRRGPAEVVDLKRQLEPLATSRACRDAGHLVAEELLAESEQTAIALADAQFGHGLHRAARRGQRQKDQCLVNRWPTERTLPRRHEFCSRDVPHVRRVPCGYCGGSVKVSSAGSGTS